MVEVVSFARVAAVRIGRAIRPINRAASTPESASNAWSETPSPRIDALASPPSPRFGYTESAAFAVKISIAAGTRSVASAILIGAAICAAPSRRLDDAASSPAAAGGSNRAATNLPSLDVRNAPIGRNPAPYCNPYSPNARYAASGSIGTRARARKRSEDAPNSAPGSPNERASPPRGATRRRREVARRGARRRQSRRRATRKPERRVRDRRGIHRRER